MWDSLLQPIIPQTGACACPTSAMDWGCVVEVLQNILNLAITFGTLMVIFFIMYAGVMMLTNPNSPSARLKARTRLLNAVIGLFVMLTGWLVVDYIMKVLYNPDTADFGPWNEILAPNANTRFCIKPTDQGILTTGIFDTIGNVVNPGTNSSVAYGGSCRVPTNPNNPCSVEALANTCFAKAGRNGSIICYKETGGRAQVPSGTDKLNKGRGPSYSWGLWQVNLTVHKLQDESGKVLNCPAAFTNPCSGSFIRNQGKVGWCDSSIKDQQLYNDCVRAAKNPRINTQVACKLYDSKFSAWRCSASRCSIPGAATMSGKCAPGT